jgi:hypothetical protein
VSVDLAYIIRVECDHELRVRCRFDNGSHWTYFERMLKAFFHWTVNPGVQPRDIHLLLRVIFERYLFSNRGLTRVTISKVHLVTWVDRQHTSRTVLT